MSTTIPDGVEAARARQARDTVAIRLHISGDEAIYALSYLRYRLGIIARPTHSTANPRWVEREVDAYLTLARFGQDEDPESAA